MSEAPRDGSHILAVVEGDVSVVSWTKTGDLPAGAWKSIEHGSKDEGFCEPDLWLPMPKLPADVQDLHGKQSEPAIHELSEACRYYDYGAGETLVWFSGLHEPFLPRKILDENGINGLFIIDKNFDWFTGGIAGLATTFEESVAAIKGFLDGHDASISVGGQSSGGYAALRMAHIVRPALCIAFSPQTQNLHGQPGVHLPPLGPIYSADPPDYPVVLHLARSEKDNEHGTWDDWAQIAPFMDLDNVTVVRHPYDVHAVSLPLYGKRRFLETIVSNMRLYAMAS